MTFDEAVVEIASNAKLSAANIDDLHDAYLDDQRDVEEGRPNPNRVMLIVQEIRLAGNDPERTGWQTAADIMGRVTDGAAKVAPLVQLFGALAAL